MSDRGFARRSVTLLAGIGGAAVLVGLILHAGPGRLATQLRALGPLLPLLLLLTGVRYVLQAAGWRLAIAPADRPGWTAFLNAVVVGEALGYVAWGPIAREPAKAFFLRPRVPVGVALSAALVERAIFVLTATVLAVVAVGLLAARRWLFIWLVAATALLATVPVTARRLRRTHQAPRANRVASSLNGGDLCTPPSSSLAGAPSPRSAPRATFDIARDLWRRRPAALLGIAGLATAQEAINVLEAYLIFVWLGAAPTVTVAIIFEGLSRFVNAAGQLVPGRVGVYEAASALLADALSLGASYGVSLALARRTRSLIWAVPGAVLLAHRGYYGTVQAAGRKTVAPAPVEAQV